ncbi:unnamed protein product [Pieris brassicae]|uniref:Protein krueppel n=1 Tax=Pieris brassicae TaxID=7116 RepID=A0A9P0TYD7_PIEBR|nr:unnamed protein product [Pieris brassicae]
MVVCRACNLGSSATAEWVLFDDNIMLYFNLLTNLNVNIDDGFSQHLCETCNNIIHQFMEFRSRCISIDFNLRNNLICKVKSESDIINDVKQENLENEGDIANYDNYNGLEQSDEMYKEEIVDDQNSQYKIPRRQRRLKTGKQQHSIKDNSKKANQTNQTTKCKVKCSTKGYSCGLCLESFNHDLAHKNHLEMHKISNDCSICNKKFTNQYQTLAHRIIHLPSDERNCYMCHKKFHKEHYLEYHYKKYHSDEANTNIECGQCKREFRNPKNLTRHLLNAHSDARDIMICDFCKKIYNSKYRLILHINMHLNRRQWKCKKCEFSTNFRSSLRVHVINRHTIGKVICKICSKAFPNQERFENHKCKPRDGDDICPICGKSGIKRLQRHIHSHTTDRKFKCDRCPAAYKSRTALRVHIDSHDGLRRLKCEYCPMTFRSGPVLIKHRRTHTGEKPFVCKICQKGFTGNYNLKVHMKVHGITNLIVKKNQDGEIAKESNLYYIT